MCYVLLYILNYVDDTCVIDNMNECIIHAITLLPIAIILFACTCPLVLLTLLSVQWCG